MKNLISKVKSSVVDAGRSVSSSVEGAIEDVKTTARETSSSVAQAGKDAALAAESSVLGARDAVLDKVAGATGAAMKVYYGIASTVHILASAGIVVVAVVAPVPFVVGVGLLWLIEMQIKMMSSDVDSAVKDEQSSRKMERVTGLLKKYGKIPESATMQTKFITMSVNSRSGEVTGKVLAGEFEGVNLDDLSNEDLDRLTDFVRDDETKSILEAYRSLRNTRVTAEQAAAALAK